MNRLREKTTTTLLIAIFMISTFAVAIPVSAQTTWTVGPGGTYDFVTIEGAIEAAISGDTIVVAVGTYSTSENGESFPITIDKPLTLKGAQFGVDPTVTGARTEESEESVLDAYDVVGSAIEIDANDVTIDGFTIKNVPSVNIPGDVRYGIKTLAQSDDHSVYSSDITIQNNILTENNRGIFLLDNENSLVRKNLINKCESISSGVYSGGSGIALSFVKPTTYVTENLLTENVAALYYYAAILVSYGGYATQPTITNNQILDNIGAPGIYLHGACAIINGNTIMGNQGGIRTWMGSSSYFQPPETLQIIENNLITGNGYGIYIVGNIPVQRIRGNTISGNAGPGLKAEFCYVPIDAILNWWGDPSGPYHLTDNPEGTGDEVKGNVLFDPWLDEPFVPISEAINDIEGNVDNHGIVNSLTSKLENALEALDEDNTEDFVNILNAFINQVEAQRGKKIDDDYANTLIAWAETWLAIQT